MSDCDCIIGEQNDHKLKISDYKIYLLQSSQIQKSLFDWGMLKHKPLSPRELADNRRGYVHRYNYCPYCGKKHNWKQLLKDVTI
jgi:hypothetical protein